MISLCMTVGAGRAEFVRQKLDHLATMHFPVRECLEICVTDGVGDSDLVAVLKARAGAFLQIKYARSHRERLPFELPAGNPTCDMNAQICNVATFEKIVRTDPEVMFTNLDSLKLVDETLERPQTCLTFWTMLSTPKFKWPVDTREALASRIPNRLICEMHLDGFFCSCFRKSDFVANGGIDERFARGYAGDDTHFHAWWRGNRTVVAAPRSHRCIHLNHGPSCTQACSVPGPLQKLRDEYTLPLFEELTRTGERPNRNNPDWQRPEMIEEIQVWK